MPGICEPLDRGYPFDKPIDDAIWAACRRREQSNLVSQNKELINAIRSPGIESVSLLDNCSPRTCMVLCLHRSGSLHRPGSGRLLEGRAGKKYRETAISAIKMVTLPALEVMGPVLLSLCVLRRVFLIAIVETDLWVNLGHRRVERSHMLSGPF
jgi:hypothetical protein